MGMLSQAGPWRNQPQEGRGEETKARRPAQKHRKNHSHRGLAVSGPRLPAAMRSTQVSRGFEPRSLDSESRVLTVTPRDQLLCFHFLEDIYCAHVLAHLVLINKANTWRTCCSRPAPGTIRHKKDGERKK